MNISSPALNVATSLVLCPVDNGGVSMEFEVSDAANGEQLVALSGFSNATPLEGLYTLQPSALGNRPLERCAAQDRSPDRHEDRGEMTGAASISKYPHHPISIIPK